MDPMDPVDLVVHLQTQERRREARLWARRRLRLRRILRSTFSGISSLAILAALVWIAFQSGRHHGHQEGLDVCRRILQPQDRMEATWSP